MLGPFSVVNHDFWLLPRESEGIVCTLCMYVCIYIMYVYDILVCEIHTCYCLCTDEVVLSDVWYVCVCNIVYYRAKFPEQLIFNCIKLRNSCDNCENFLTRDYLDFSVEHLSSTTSILNAALSSDQQKRNFFQLLNTRLENHIQTLLLKVNNKNSKNSKRGTTAPASSTSSSTIAVVAFSDSEANANISAEEASLQESLRQIRHNYFKATIYSILIHFPQIVVYVSKLKDKEKVLNWSLPLLEVIDLSATLARVPTTAYYNNRPMEQLLPKYALLDLADKMKSQSKKPSQSQSQSSPLQDPLSPSRQKEWSSYTSIFYTEGDQILHLRKLKYFYQMFDASDGDFLFIPHRLQVGMWTHVGMLLSLLPILFYQQLNRFLTLTYEYMNMHA